MMPADLGGAFAALQALTAVSPPSAFGVDAAGIAPGPGPAPSVAFGQWVSQGLDNVNQQMMVSETDLQQLAVGGAQNLHQIMIHLEETRLSFQLMLQVRNRLLESYEDVMKMTV